MGRWATWDVEGTQVSHESCVMNSIIARAHPTLFLGGAKSVKMLHGLQQHFPPKGILTVFKGALGTGEAYSEKSSNGPFLKVLLGTVTGRGNNPTHGLCSGQLPLDPQP